MEQRGCGSRFVAIMSPVYSVQALENLITQLTAVGLGFLHIDLIPVVFMEEAILKLGFE